MDAQKEITEPHGNPARMHKAAGGGADAWDCTDPDEAGAPRWPPCAQCCEALGDTTPGASVTDLVRAIT
jgi:hypothetical protein